MEGGSRYSNQSYGPKPNQRHHMMSYNDLEQRGHNYINLIRIKENAHKKFKKSMIN